MAENYEVNYNINVNSHAAYQNLLSFQTAATQLTQSGEVLKAFGDKVNAVTRSFDKMSKKSPVLKFSTSKAERGLDSIIAKMERIHALAKETASLNISAMSATPPKKVKNNTTTTPTSTRGKQTQSPSAPKPFPPKIPKNVGYRVLGPSMIDTGGIGALDIMKGMGVAYGISGVGAMMGRVVRDATEYNNLMQTTKNILSTHDKNPNFSQRFGEMEKLVRSVGVETKFTAPQVADASKFLAMAGFDLRAINQSIRPIADIALVGDTDLGETADVVTNIMTGYGISPSRVRSAADVMAMTFTASNTTLLEIAEAYKYSASLLSAGGVSFEEATAGLGILGDAGIKGSQAGTSMRTIMANLVNPTKKQQAQWDKVGVERMDESGKIRPLTDIFNDLRNKGLYVSDYYKLFHKTAAQGAVSLAANVDKWNEIVRLNFLSEGTVGKLADAKKNTIAGLWAQLTSMFTENGMQAFEELQEPIKLFLNNMIEWLKTPEAVSAIKDISKSLFELVNFLKDVTKVLLAMWNQYKGLIKTWVSLQVILSSVLIPLRTIKSLFNFGAGLVNTIKQVGALANQFGALTKKMRGFTSAKKAAQVADGSAPVVPVPGGGKGKSMRMIGLGLASMAGMAAGSYIGAEIGGGGVWGAIASLGGAALGSQLAPLLFTNPIGWGVLALGALTALAGGLNSVHNKINAASDEAGRLSKQFSISNGILTGTGVTGLMSNIDLMYNKELDITKELERRLNLRREERALTSPTEDPPAIYDGARAREVAKGLSGLAPFYVSGWRVRDAVGALVNPGGGVRTTLKANPDDRLVTGQRDVAYWVREGGVGRAILSDKALLAQAALHQEGIATGAKLGHEYFQRLKQLLADGQPWEWKNLKSEWERKIGTVVPNEESLRWKLDDIENMTPEKGATSEAWRIGMLDAMRGVWGKESPLWTSLETYEKNLAEGTLTQDNVVDMLSHVNPNLAEYLETFTKLGADAFFETLNFKDGKFIDPKTGLPAQSTAKDAIAKIQEILQAFSILPPLAKQSAADMLTTLNAFGNLASGTDFSWNGRAIIPNVLQNEGSVNGVTYMLDEVSGLYKPKDAILGGILPLAKGLTKQQFFGAMQRGGKWTSSGDGSETGGDTTTTTGTGAGTGALGGSQADYKQHYGNNSSAPKQVIVKIENLMNVESVDLANPDKAAVIADIKSELTQALVDVVHDFDTTYHG